ncbi:MAG: uridine diphosphate-N-acetylglucosamine-binding protein YvcK [Desulfobacterota bacterium]|nr:uridine diphosphate-N-acetylglucosamine-binding protein YvcK [Thermodesulfobacteriota bacterium]
MKTMKKIATIGGGTGSYVVLSGLKKHPVVISAIIGMFDDGGSTGVLRRELKVMPPGDLRQCLVALSDSDHLLKDLFDYRFSEGFLSGHSLGNIIISALEKNTGSITGAVDIISKLMNITHNVIPVTLQGTTLCAFMKDGEEVIGQDNINKSFLISHLSKLELVPDVEINAHAQKAIIEADKIVINPGDLYTSIIPHFLVKGMKEALLQSRAKLIYVANLMTINGHTDNLTVGDHRKILTGYIHPRKIDYVVYNTAVPDEGLQLVCKEHNQHPVKLGDHDVGSGIGFVGEDLIDRKIYEKRRGDKLYRSLIRHNADKLADIIHEL